MGVWSKQSLVHCFYTIYTSWFINSHDCAFIPFRRYINYVVRYFINYLFYILD